MRMSGWICNRRCFADRGADYMGIAYRLAPALIYWSVALMDMA